MEQNSQKEKLLDKDSAKSQTRSCNHGKLTTNTKKKSPKKSPDKDPGKDANMK